MSVFQTFCLSFRKTNFNPILHEGGQKDNSTGFSHVCSTNIGNSPPKFLTFSSTLLQHLRKTLRPYLLPIPIIELEPRASLKIFGFSGQNLIKLRS